MVHKNEVVEEKEDIAIILLKVIGKQKRRGAAIRNT